MLLVLLVFLGVAPVQAQRGGGGAVSGADKDLEALSRAGAGRSVGPDTARVEIIEFLDFACTTCQQFHMQRGDSLRRALGPDVRLVYVNFLHTNFLRSFHAAEAANCAALVGGREAYTGMADRLFRNASEWSDAEDPSDAFARYAHEIRIDTAAFGRCRALDTTAPLVVNDMQTAQVFGIEGTPEFIFVPRGAQSAAEALRISGNVSIAQITALIAQARAKAK
jgi:protein-disulfide isomerase